MVVFVILESGSVMAKTILTVRGMNAISNACPKESVGPYNANVMVHSSSFNNYQALLYHMFDCLFLLAVVHPSSLRQNGALFGRSSWYHTSLDGVGHLVHRQPLVKYSSLCCAFYPAGRYNRRDLLYT